ncbi:protein kinase [Oscillatoria sp. FACHB-1406]|uniref:protein kinase domain-containing protein n=1 Tax=Oscillatoria sp. FACHB-1406 TaxID=2692846 RepID=UPI00168865F4|nr:protein kinase [Oscillatoria sp. FACHB-1406]MBD2579057.1 protein kinase [Oscillatoria sp. FACHB-1406]
MITIALLDPKTHNPTQTWAFRDSEAIRIGRANDNEIVLDRNLEVSRYHAELRSVARTPGQHQWQLLGRGANGTFLNGVLVSQAFVPDNALLQLAKGGPLLRIDLSEVAAPPVSPGCTHAGNAPNTLFCVHCGQPIVEEERFVRQYQVLRVLGRGGMGTTYLAWDKAGSISGRPITLVLKEMNADMAKVPKAQELFEREARILKNLAHPGIPKYYDFFIEQGKKYLAMELIHGQNLEQRIYQKGPVAPQLAIEWMLQTCDILGYLHSLDPPLVHRDVKPANLMLRNVDNRIVLLDFGAVKEIGTPMGTRIGAEGYSAPEQDRGQPCPQSDLFAIGPTLTFLLSGESPIRYYKSVDRDFRLSVGSIPSINAKLQHVIETASEPQLRRRYQTAKELFAALTDCL